MGEEQLRRGSGRGNAGVVRCQYHASGHSEMGGERQWCQNFVLGVQLFLRGVMKGER